MAKLGLRIVVCIAVAAASAGFRHPDATLRWTTPQGWPRPLYTFKRNVLTDAGFRLGRELFYDPKLSGDGRVSCGTCHQPEAGFCQPGHAISAGSGGARGLRHAPALMNLAWNSSFMWDGGVNHLEVQPLAPITSKDEMNTSLAAIVRYLSFSSAYKRDFFAVYGDSAITGERVLKVMAQFTGMLVSFNSRYDKYLRGEPGGDLSELEFRGLRVFRANCASCHPEPLFTNYSFMNIGLPTIGPQPDIGRMRITQDSGDSLKFKVPTLRNVAVTAPYMHDGRFSTLMDVMNHYSDGAVASPTLARELKEGMPLTAYEKEALIAFLGTLTDSVFLNESAYRLRD